MTITRGKSCAASAESAPPPSSLVLAILNELRSVFAASPFERRAFEAYWKKAEAAAGQPVPADKVEATLDNAEVLPALRNYISEDLRLTAAKFGLALLEKKMGLATNRLRIAIEEHLELDLGSTGDVDILRGVVRKEDPNQKSNEAIRALAAVRKLLAMDTVRLKTLTTEDGRAADELAGGGVPAAFLRDLAEELCVGGKKIRALVNRILSNVDFASEVSADEDGSAPLRYLANMVRIAKETNNDPQG